MRNLTALLLAGVVGAALSSTASAAEYRSSLTRIGVTPTLHRTFGMGENAAVGVLDGLAQDSHYDLAGRLTDVPYSGGIYSGFDRHATHVSGIIGAGVNGQGVVGVAPEVDIRSYGLFAKNGWVGWDLGRAAFDDAVAHGVSVVNMSYGPSGSSSDIFLNGELNLFKTYGNALVMVRSAGNSGANALRESYAGDASAELGHILVVGSVDSNNKISSFSNKPGTACIGPSTSCAADDKISNFFIVAPGRSILSDVPTDSLAYMSGTSMAAPHVAGAAALLQSYWPHLKADPDGTANILKWSATDLGAPGVDAVYGWGLLNVARAFQPIGQPVIPTGTTVSQGGKPLQSSSLTKSSTLPGGRAMANALDGLIVLDDLGRDFAIAVPEPVAAAAPITLEDRLSGLRLALAIPGGARFAPGEGLSFVSTGEALDGGDFASVGFASDGFDLSVGVGATNLYFGRAEGGAAADADASLGRHLLLGLSEAGEAFDQGTFATSRIALSDGLSLATFFATSDSPVKGADAVSPLGQQLETAPRAELIGFQARYLALDRLAFDLTYGALREHDRFLGAQSSGAFALGSAPVTQSLGLGVSYAFSDRLSAALFYDHVRLDADAASGSLYGGADGWVGRKFGTALSLDGVFTGTDRFTVAALQPLNIFEGTATATVPVGRDLDGNVIYQSRAYSVASDAVPLELSFSYLDAAPDLPRGLTFSVEDSDIRDRDGLNVNVVATVSVPF
jgi:hypothetical protein